jgi:hypothetical protein
MVGEREPWLGGEGKRANRSSAVVPSSWGDKIEGSELSKNETLFLFVLNGDGFRIEEVELWRFNIGNSAELLRLISGKSVLMGVSRIEESTEESDVSENTESTLDRIEEDMLECFARPEAWMMSGFVAKVANSICDCAFR